MRREKTLRKYPMLQFQCQCGYRKLFIDGISPTALLSILKFHYVHDSPGVSGAADYWWSTRIVYAKRWKR